MKTSKPILVAVVLAASALQCTLAADLQRGTLKAWKAYLKGVNFGMRERAASERPFLWIDESPNRAAQVRRGEVVVAPVVGHGTESVPHGLIHDWIGAIFIPGATINDLWSVLHNYDQYRNIYGPAVTSSKALACTDNRQEFQMIWQRKVLLVNAAIQSRCDAHDVVLDAHRGYSLAEAVEVREIEGYGHKKEYLLPPDTGNGFIWRIRSLSRYEERDGGLYLEVNVTALTRDIPETIAWMVYPVVNHVSVNSLRAVLRQTRDAVVRVRLEAGAPGSQVK